MESKWLFISRVCRENRMIKPALIAEKIENILRKNYTNTITNEWKENYHKYREKYESIRDNGVSFYFFLSGIINNRKYCVACSQSQCICEKCKFGLEAGKCSEKDSIFNIFIQEFISSYLKIYED